MNQTIPQPAPMGLAKLRRASETATTSPIITIYGTPGIGKTTFAAQFPSPIMLNAEGGLGLLRIDNVPVSSWGDVVSTIDTLGTDHHEWQTLIVDTLDAVEPLLWDEVSRRNGWKSIETPGYGKGYSEAVDVWRKEFMGRLANLRDAKNMIILLLAHAEAKLYKSPTTEPYDRFKLALNAKAADVLVELSDIVGFANYETFARKVDAGMNKHVIGMGDGQRILHLAERPAFTAKSRYSNVDSIPLDYAAFMAAISPPQL